MKKLCLTITLLSLLIFPFLLSMEFIQQPIDPDGTVTLIRQYIVDHGLLRQNQINHIEAIGILNKSLEEANSQPLNKSSIMSLINEGKTAIKNFNDTTQELMTIEDALQKEISSVMAIISNNNQHNKYSGMLSYLKELKKEYNNKIDSNLNSHETYEHIKKDFDTIQSQCESIANDATETYEKPSSILLQEFLTDLFHLSLFAFLGWQGRPHSS